MSKIPEDAKKVYEWILFDVYQKEVQQFDGSHKLFEWVRSYDIVKAIIVDGEKICIALDEQPLVTRHNLFGGMIERGEVPLNALKREILEEAWIVCEDKNIHFWTTLPQRVGCLEWYVHYYICRHPKFVAEPKHDVGEKITLLSYTFDEFIDLVVNKWIARELGNLIVREYVLPAKIDELKKKIFEG